MALWQELRSDDHEVVPYALAGEDAGRPAQTTKGEVRAIVRGRMLRLFGHVAERIERSGVARYAMQRMVLTGGASQQAGLGEFAADFFARPVRVARMRAARRHAGRLRRSGVLRRPSASFTSPSIPAQARAGTGAACEAGGLFAAYGTVAPGRLLRGSR